MTTRLTVAVAVLTVGLAIAALAGVPVLIENRAIGDVVVIIGLAIAMVGSLLVVLAVPGQRRENGRSRLGAEADVNKLRLERRRLWERKTDALARLGDAITSRDASRMAGLETSAAGYQAVMTQIQTENGDIDTALDVNANEFRRHGIEPPAPGALGAFGATAQSARATG